MVTQVFQPAVSPISQSAARRDGAAPAGLETRGTCLRQAQRGWQAADLEVCATPARAAKLISLTDFFTVEQLRQMLGQGYLLQPGDDGQEAFHRAIDRLWAAGDGANLLPTLRRLVERMYPSGRALAPAARQAVAEESLLAVYLHSHMDEDTLDLARLTVCPDQVPDPEGRLIPACAYNLFYREKDPRFWCG